MLNLFDVTGQKMIGVNEGQLYAVIIFDEIAFEYDEIAVA
ncbi:hypothetical protein QE382_002921 [Sphingobacterium zeae]|uniref:Uncharacterized protein n=1 Tax=Sphingobacterium zeae TaxID=1776859 RepID=A0ABU0U7J1_9SPHI|nr:hypothetical protein [Sphingobacterium zeae]